MLPRRHALTVAGGDNTGVDPVGGNGCEMPQLRALIDAVIAPHAETVDSVGVSRSAIDALAAEGYLGSTLPPEQLREVGELIAAADASTWFCWVQHQTPLRTLSQAFVSEQTPLVAELQARLLGGMRSGAILSAVAFAHVRRPGPANPVMTRTSGGWLLNGTLDWITSWDIADVVMVMARGDGPNVGSLISAFLPAGRAGITTPGFELGEPLSLLAMSGTHTRPATLRDVFIADADVASVVDAEQWLSEDARRSSDAGQAAFGVTRGALRELNDLAIARGDEVMAAVVEHLAAQCRAIRSRSGELAEHATPENEDERLVLRAASLDLVVRAATAVVIARSGSVMASGNSAERRVREAMFLQVQAQTAASRRASLRRLTSSRNMTEIWQDV